MTTTQQFIDEVRTLHNHICILGCSSLGRVVGVHFDDTDVFYRVRKMSHAGQPPVDRYESLVGGAESLKGLTRGYDHMDSVFAMNGAPPTGVFTVSADARDTFATIHGEEGLAHYDEDIAPALTSDASPATEEAEEKAAFAALHAAFPEKRHEVAISRSMWMGAEDGVDTFKHAWTRRNVAFDRRTGVVTGDLETGETSTDADMVFAHYSEL